jgi:hypothetical protein
VNEALLVFGNAYYLFTKLKTDTSSERAPGWVAATGVKNSFTRNFSGNLGCQIETTNGQNPQVKVTFRRRET